MVMSPLSWRQGKQGLPGGPGKSLGLAGVERGDFHGRCSETVPLPHMVLWTKPSSGWWKSWLPIAAGALGLRGSEASVFCPHLRGLNSSHLSSPACVSPQVTYR